MRTKSILVVAALSIVSCLSSIVANATEIDYGYVTKQASGTTNADVIFAAASTKTIRLVSLDVTNNSPVVGLVRYYGGTERAQVTNAALSTATNFLVSSSGNLASNDIVVIQKATLTNTTDLVTGQVWGVQGGTNIQLTGQIGIALAAGDAVYRMSTVVTNIYGYGNYRENGEAIFACQLRQPLLIRAVGTNTVTAVPHATIHYDN